MNSLKDKIILNVFEYIETGDISHSIKAQEHLRELAKHYHISIKKQAKKDIKICFKAFISNGRGYVETIPNLLNSL